ncbi:MAG TPA: L-arabinose isomerase [Chitinophagaceae bacterium]|nr:L-arabinose isomerase [Chitinophagaceae bacterium]
MSDLKQLEAWFVTGSQHLYGEMTLRQVDAHAEVIAGGLDGSGAIPVRIRFKPVLTSPEAIRLLCQEANSTENCIGIIAWMHTFSPSKMWIGGLKILSKPLMHLHTQFNRDIPWDQIDMNFMNLNQSAHGDREFGFLLSRMRMDRKVVTGHWEEEAVRTSIGIWCRAACGWHDWQGAKFVRFGDNMRFVGVTEGDKVEAELRLGYSVNTHGVGDLADAIAAVPDSGVEQLIAEYREAYTLSAPLLKAPGQQSLKEAARIEAGLRTFLRQGNFKGFTDTFEDLHGLLQLPGIAAQRLMQEGYGFAAEGDWKTSALVRAMKFMATGLNGGNSFMEDYTYHFEQDNEMVLGSHMLEICPSIASAKPSCEIHPLGIGGKADPVRLVFTASPGQAINASLIDLGDRFRLIVNEVEGIDAPHPLPKLPVARAFWIPRPDMRTGCTAWIQAGGAHHTCFSQNLTVEHMRDFAAMAGMECVVIDSCTRLSELINELKWNDVYYRSTPR